MNELKKIVLLADLPQDTFDGVVSGRGGGQGATWFIQLYEQFKLYKEYEIVWISLSKDIKKRKSRTCGNQTHILLPSSHFYLNVLSHYILTTRRIRKEIDRINPDLIHAWGVETPYAFCLKRLKKIGVPSVLSIQGLLTAYSEAGILPKNIFWRLQTQYERNNIPHASHVTVESEWAHEKLLSYYPSCKSSVIDYGVHPIFKEIKREPKKDDKFLLFMGYVGMSKGIDLILGMEEQLRQKGYKIVIAGAGPMQNEVAKRASDVYDYKGILSWQELIPLMSSAWGLIIPTRADTGPSASKECLVSGIPVVGSKNGGLRDYVEHGVSGYLMEEYTSDELFSCCDALLSGYEKMIEMGESRREVNQERFSPVLCAEKFISLYNSLLD